MCLALTSGREACYKDSMAQAALNERSCEVLKDLIQEYIQTSEPVGSRRLARLSREKLSAATIRNIMADLEEAGMLSHPHTSAGRVPTESAFRFYVDGLLEKKKLTRNEENRIHQTLDLPTGTEELMSRTSEVLSSLSTNVGFVISRPLAQTAMKHIEFVQLSENRILVILVDSSGMVLHKLIQWGESMSQADLDFAGRFLVENFSGQTLPVIRLRLLDMMKEEKALYDRLLKNALALGVNGVEAAEAESSGVYLGGTSQILKKPEFSDINRMVSLFETFEKKHRLVQILSECLQGERQSGLQVVIGLGDNDPSVRGCAVIFSPYRMGDQVLGTLGVLGPTRMEYGKAIPLVDYVARLFGEILSKN